MDNPAGNCMVSRGITIFIYKEEKMEDKRKIKNELQNKSFDLFGTQWRIKLKDKVLSGEDQHWVWGLTDGEERVIYISTKKSDGSLVPLKELKITILHELVHAIFITGQYAGSNDDEPLVEWIARCMNKLLENDVMNYIKNLNYDTQK